MWKIFSSEQTKEIILTLVEELKDCTIEGKCWCGVVSVVANSVYVHEQQNRRIRARTLANFQDQNVRAFRVSPKKRRD